MALPEPEVCPSTRDIRDLLALARALRDRGAGLLARPDLLQRQAERQLTDLLKQQIRARLGATPVDCIGAVVGSRDLRDPLERASLCTVADLLDTPHTELARVTGLGSREASQLIAAAGRLAIALTRDVAVRLDPAERDDAQAELLTTLAALRRALDATVGLRARVEELNAEIEELIAAAGRADNGFRMRLCRRYHRDSAQVAAVHLRRFMFSRSTVSLAVELRQRCAEMDAWAPDPEWLWRDFEADPASYQVLLDGLSPQQQDLDGLRALARLVLDQPLRPARRKPRRYRAAQ